MSNRTSEDQQTCRDFIQCLSQFVTSGTRFEVDESKEKTGSDVVVRIIPLSKRAATIDARLELDFGVYLLFGVSAQFEVPFSKGYYTGGDWLTELNMLCNTVANGNFQERVMYIGEKAIYSKHQLLLESGRIIQESWGTRPILSWKKTQMVEHNYIAYRQVVHPLNDLNEGAASCLVDLAKPKKE